MHVPELVASLRDHRHNHYPERSLRRDRTLYALSLNKKTSEQRVYNPDGQPLALELPRHLLLVALHTGEFHFGPFDPTTPDPDSWETVRFFRTDTEPYWKNQSV